MGKSTSACKLVRSYKKLTMKKFLIITFVVLLFFCKPQEAFLLGEEKTVHFMEPGDWLDNNNSGLQIFCNNAKSKTIIYIWKTITMSIKTNLETYEVYEGRTPQEVSEKHEDNQRYWRFSLFNSKKTKNFQLNPFEDNCIGVFMPKNQNQYQYRIVLTQNSVDSWRLAMTLLGFLLFWYALVLSRNTLFYYLCGITIGVSLSIIITIYFVGKIIPNGRFMYAMLAGGCAMSLYVAQMILENAQIIAVQYRDWVLCYILATSIISFIICYWFGPITNPRTKNIIQWILQALGLAIIYYSSYFHEVSLMLCVLLVLAYNFPIFFIIKGRKYWNHIFPGKPKLLSDDEYRKQGIIETKKALDGLKEFCSTPESSPWKTVLRLKDPIRFAKFMEGDCHLSDNESMEHDKELTRLIEECDYTDDESMEGGI